MQQFILQHPWVIYALIVWTLPWKGVALWKSAQNKHKIWFVILFLVNSLAILDIIYIFTSGRNKSEKKEEDAGTDSGDQNNPANGPIRRMV